MRTNLLFRQTGLCDNVRQGTAQAIRNYMLATAPQYDASIVRDGEFHVYRRVGLWEWFAKGDGGIVASIKVWYTAYPGCGMVVVYRFYKTRGVEELFTLISEDVAEAFSHHEHELFWAQ